MVEYKDRLHLALKEAEKSTQDLADHLKVSYQAVKKVLDGKSTAFTAINNAKAAEFLGISSFWLATGKGAKSETEDGLDDLPMFSRAQPRTTEKGNGVHVLEQIPSGIPSNKFKSVWVVGRGAGGLMPESVWSDGDFPVGATDEYAEIASQDPHAFLTHVVGTSMVPRYNPGEYALVEPGTEPDIEDDVLVRLVDGQTLLKRLLSRRGGFRLGSYNDAEVYFYELEQVTWIYYVAHPVPRRKIKQRAGSDIMNW